LIVVQPCSWQPSKHQPSDSARCGSATTALGGRTALGIVGSEALLSDNRSRVLAGIAVKAGVALPDAVRDLMADCAGLLVAFAVGALGDPRLTAWEEGFICSLLETGMIRRPSDKQIGVLGQIAATVEPAVGQAAD